MISSIRLQNFRSYRDASFEFDPGVNIVVGPNASGKTNLLEAVLVLGRGGSYRVRDVDLVKFGKPWARLDGYFGKHSRTLKVELPDSKTVKTYLLDEKPYRRLNLERTIPMVLFEPNHLQLITRGPERRRDFFDELLERSRPGYRTLAAQYRRALAQRNTLLKRSPSFAQKQLFVWNVRLSELGSQIASARSGLIKDINRTLGRTYSQIAGRKTNVKLEYDCQFPIDSYASRLLAKLDNHAVVDFERGFTAHGPHREDISLYLNKQPMAQAASRGETRSLLLALKIYELKLIEKTRGERPVFLLDDVFSELDGARRHALVEYLKDYQSVITTTDADAVIEHFTEGHNLIPLG